MRASSLEDDDEGLLVVGPEDVRFVEDEAFPAGVRILEMRLNETYLNAYDVPESEEVVLRAYVFLTDLVPMRALFVVPPQVDVENVMFQRALNDMRETYGLHHDKILIDIVVGAYTAVNASLGRLF